MKISVFSDLHLEFYDTLHPKLDHGDADVLVNAGDTHPDPRMRSIAEEVMLGKNYVKCMGNHDYYSNRQQFPTVGQDQWTHEFDGVKFAACTLWTNFSASFYPLFDRSMADARLILGIDYEKMIAKFQDDLKFLERSEADVFVTHHTPSMMSCHHKWGGVDQPMNRFFHNELSAWLLDLPKKPKLWIHGHTHDPCNYRIGETLVVCNPRGYPGERSEKYKSVFVEIGQDRAELLT